MGYMAFAKQCIPREDPDMGTGITDLGSMVNGILTFVRGTAQRLEIAEVDWRLLARVMDVGRAALEEFVVAKGTRYTGRQFLKLWGHHT
jgi:hypothetical protein